MCSVKNMKTECKERSILTEQEDRKAGQALWTETVPTKKFMC